MIRGHEDLLWVVMQYLYSSDVCRFVELYSMSQNIMCSYVLK